MTRYLIALLFFYLLFMGNANGQNNHRLGLFSTLNTKQTDTLGLAIKYQWQFKPSFAFESQYSTSGDIKIITNSNSYIGDQSLLSVGAVFLKQYSPRLTVKISSGANYVVSSSNNRFIQQSSISPYLKLALEYQLTEQLLVEAGQASFFQGDKLGNNHHFFIGINYLFSLSPDNSVKPAPSIKSLPSAVTRNSNSLATASNEPLITKNKVFWVLQLGAYKDEFYAYQALIEFKLKPLFAGYRVEYFNDYFRILSPKFDTYKAAQQDSIKLVQQQGVANLIKQRD